MAEVAAPVLDDLGDVIQPLGKGIDHGDADEGQHGILVPTDGLNELAQWFLNDQITKSGGN